MRIYIYMYIYIVNEEPGAGKIECQKQHRQNGRRGVAKMKHATAAQAKNRHFSL